MESAAALAVCQLLPDTPADLDGLRCRLDETDAAILELFDRRQRLSAAIGAYKSAHGLPVRDKAREAEVLRTRGDMLPERRDQAERLMTLLMALSRHDGAAHPHRYARRRQDHHRRRPGPGAVRALL